MNGTGSAVQELFDEVREAGSARVWSRGVELARKGAVSAEAGGFSGEASDDEIRLRVVGKGVMALQVSLHPADVEWSCTCRSAEDPCDHVAAAVIALKRARERGESLPRAVGRGSAHVGYRFDGREGPIVLTRVLVREDEDQGPLPASIVAIAAGRPHVETFSATAVDTNYEKRFGPAVRVQIPPNRMPEVLDAVRDCEDVRLDGVPIRIGETTSGMRLKVEQMKDGRFLARLEQDPAVSRIYPNGAVVSGKALRAIGPHGIDPSLFERLRRGWTCGPAEAAELVGSIIPEVRKRVPVLLDAPDLPASERMRPRLVLDTQRVDADIVVLPSIVYGDPPVARVDGDRLTILDPDAPAPIRDARLESRLAARATGDLGLKPGVRVALPPSEAIALIDRLGDDSTAPILRGLSTGDLRERGALAPRLREQGGELTLEFVIDPGSDDDRGGSGRTAAAKVVAQADAAAVVASWRGEEALVPLLDGGFGRIPAGFMAAHGHLVADLLAAKEAAKELGSEGLRRALLPDYAKLCEALEQPPPDDYSRLKPMLDGFAGIDAARLPDDLNAELRSYQRSGVDWLSFMARAGLSALLADDMGLGKTLQALCVVEGRCLVVAPTSVMHNWAREAARFRPDLNVAIYHGPNRSLDDSADLTVTTYALLRNDIETLEGVQWNVAILDEAQSIKNPDSQVARAAYRLEADFKIAMSGTPLENRLDDLWSLFRFLQPGLLGGRTRFRDGYVRAIAAGDEETAAHLRARIRPFVMRRRKSEVAPELPPRTDLVIECELDDRERAVYDAVRAAAQDEVVGRLGEGQSVLEVLEALLRLRQAACHPSLLPTTGATKDAANPVEEGSSKTRVLVDRLLEARAEGHKALVFSQWTSLLDLVEPLLQEARLDFVRLDGATRDRGAVVDAFQDADGPPVMLLSLKAGGTGLNLTAADHVFLLDPWWNPAVEDQAADRAHRIGQDRPVFVHRLVARETVEERILELQERKRALADAALGEAPAAASAITKDELLALLA